MEAIFPDKKVYVHTVSFINLLVQAFTAFFAAIATLWRVSGAGYLCLLPMQCHVLPRQSAG
jgi:hypothetical protein